MQNLCKLTSFYNRRYKIEPTSKTSVIVDTYSVWAVFGEKASVLSKLDKLYVAVSIL